MIARTRNPQVKALIAILYLTGARISECLAMRTSMVFVNKEGDISLIMKTLKRIRKWAQRFTTPDGKILIRKWIIRGRPQFFEKITGQLYIGEVIETQKAINNPYDDTRAMTFKANTPLLDVFMAHFQKRQAFGGDYPMFDYSRIHMWRLLHQSNPNLSPHAFRHSRLQKLADRGASGYQIKAFAGHRSLDSGLAYIENSKAQTEALKELID